jgi:type IV secretory pathway TrbD component
MSAVERPVPPAGEEIHLPGGSLQPLLLTVGITMALCGVTISTWVLIAGIVLCVVVLARWVVEARHEFEHLPAEHHPVSHDTAPIDPPHPTRVTSEG